MGSLIRLEVLFLNSNQLSGNIPAELGNLSNLVMLWLQDNLLVGDIPSSFINLVNLIDPGYGMDGLRPGLQPPERPPGYPDPGDPLHVFLFQKDPDWHLRQV